MWVTALPHVERKAVGGTWRKAAKALQDTAWCFENPRGRWVACSYMSSLGKATSLQIIKVEEKRKSIISGLVTQKWETKYITQQMYCRHRKLWNDFSNYVPIYMETLKKKKYKQRKTRSEWCWFVMRFGKLSYQLQVFYLLKWEKLNSMQL